MWFDLRFDHMRSHRDWCITRAVLCRPCRYHRSQSSYDDSSWRQTAFSQSVALMSPLCPSVQREGWLSLVCVGDHSTIRPSQAFLSLISLCVWKVCQRGQYINTAINAVRLLCLPSCASTGEIHVFLWECVGKCFDRLCAAFKMCVLTVCSQSGACNSLHVASNQSLNRPSFNSRFQDISSFQSSKSSCADF